jgi:hypothetical protein
MAFFLLELVLEVEGVYPRPKTDKGVKKYVKTILINRGRIILCKFSKGERRRKVICLAF